MPKGGARVRSGPAADPSSGRSERRGAAAVNVTALPSEGRSARPPAFPLPRVSRLVTFTVDGQRVTKVNEKATKDFRARELQIWREVWKTPQACAWYPDRWRWPTIAEFCRIKAAVERDPDSSAALVSRLREYRNEIGLSPDGLRANGWSIAVDEVGAKAGQRTRQAATAKKAAVPSRRLRSVPSS